MTITLNNPLLILCLFYFALSSFIFYLFKRSNLFFKIIVFSAIISAFIVVEQVNRIEVTISALMGFFVIYRETIFEFFAGAKYFIENIFFSISSFFRSLFNACAWLFNLFGKLSPQTQEAPREPPRRTNNNQNRESEQTQNQQQERQNRNHAEQERIRQAKEDLKRQREKAREEQVDQDSRSPQKILGLHDGFTFSDLKKAYKQAVSRYHPDKYAHMSESFQKEAEQELVKVQVAYNELLKKAK